MRNSRMLFITSTVPHMFVSMTPSKVFISFLLLIKAISSCIILPSEHVAIVGDRILFNCNARPNNQQQGSIASIKLGSDGASGTDIFRPPAYGPGGQIIQKQILAEGYFLSHLDGLHTNVIIQINETQFKHGGRYFCSCVESTSRPGTANFTVLEKLSFGRNGDQPLKPGALVDLNCSVSFNGSTSSAFIDLTISNANGTQISEAKNLSLISSIIGHHVIHRKVVVDPNREQRFTCEAKVWNKSSTGGSPLRSLTSNFSLKPDQIYVTTSAHHSLSPSPPAIGHTAFIAVGVFAILLVVVVIVAVIYIYKKCHTRSITKSDHSVGNISNQPPPHMMPQYQGVTAQSHYESIDKENRIIGLNQTYQELNLNDQSIHRADPHYESIDNEKRIAESNQAYEELNLNDHSVQTGQYIDIIP